MADKINFRKIIPRYILTGILGAVIVSTGCSLFQIYKVKKTIDQTNILFQEKAYDEALEKLLQAEFWATRYPDLAVALNMATIKCHVMRNDMRSAENAAKRIFAGQYGKARRSRSTAEFIQNAPNSLISLLLKNQQLTRFSGYEELISSVRQSDSYLLLPSIAKDIIALDPNSQLALKVKAYIPDEETPVVVQPIQPPKEEAAAIKIPDKEPKAEDPRVLLDKYIALKDWDKVLEQCEILLKNSPSDLSLLEIRKLAAAKGLRWAVVKKQNASVYDTSGKVLTSMPAGTLLDISSITKTTRESLALCSAAEGASSPASTFLLRCQDLTINIGDRKSIPEDSQNLFKKEATLNAEIISLRAKLVAAFIDTQNPHASAYKTAKQAHEAYWTKVRAIQKKRDDTTNPDERVKCNEELGQMKGEDIRLGTALEVIKKKYDQAAANAPANIKSAQLDALQTEINAVREKIKAITK